MSTSSTGIPSSPRAGSDWGAADGDHLGRRVHETAGDEQGDGSVAFGVARPDELRGFTGRAGEWAYVAAESTETKLVFHRGAAPAKKAAAAKKGRAEGASPARGRKAAKK